MQYLLLTVTGVVVQEVEHPEHCGEGVVDHTEGDEAHEDAVVVLAHAVVDPRTVVVISLHIRYFHALVAVVAVPGVLGLAIFAVHADEIAAVFVEQGPQVDVGLVLGVARVLGTGQDEEAQGQQEDPGLRHPEVHLQPRVDYRDDDRCTEQEEQHVEHQLRVGVRNGAYLELEGVQNRGEGQWLLRRDYQDCGDVVGAPVDRDVQRSVSFGVQDIRLRASY